MAAPQQNIAIIGGGVTGLSVAWQLSRHGHKVTVYEQNQFGQAASQAGAGMLAPQAEAKFEEENLMKLGQLSLSWYPEFLAQLRADLGRAPAFDQCGTLLVGVSRDDTAQLKRLFQFRESLNLNIEWLTGSEAREQVPALSPRVSSAMWLPHDAQIDNHQLLRDLVSVLEKQDQTLQEGVAVTSLNALDNHQWQVATGQHRSEVFDQVVIASGAWSAAFQQAAGGAELGLRPVKGELLALTQTAELPLNVMIRTPRAYLVPKADGSLLIGATSYEKGFEHWPSAGGVKDLLEFGYETLPAVYDLPLDTIRVGLRPATKDNSPAIGPGAPGAYWATGHYRHGYLLAPLTAYALVQWIEGKEPDPLIASFSPERFKQPLVNES